MARQPDIQYVSIYTHGSAARKLEIQPKKKVALPKPKVRRDKRTVLYVDPLSVCAVFAAGLLLIAMAVGMIRLGVASSQAQKAQEYVAQLEAENAQLRDIYLAGYDAQEVRRQAEEMGMIPIEDAPHVTIDVQIPQPEAEPTIWENIGLFFSELFA